MMAVNEPLRPTEFQAPPIPARRRLIGATFGVPAALALHSGGAFAASNCVARRVTGTPEVPALVATGDSPYIRVPLYPRGSSFFISGADIHQWASVPGVANASTISPTMYREVTISGGVVTVGTQDQSVTANSLGTPSRYLVVRFRSGGTPDTVDVLGVFDSTNSSLGTALAESCWSSFAIAAKLRAL
jgi:hypothetical protein